jgi:hypothetical protein
MTIGMQRAQHYIRGNDVLVSLSVSHAPCVCLTAYGRPWHLFLAMPRHFAVVPYTGIAVST